MSELGLWLTIGAILGGLLWHWRRRPAAVCPPGGGPRLQPLQVSYLAVQALGVGLYLRLAPPGAPLVSPATALPLACVLIGLAGLGVLSLSATCRDDALRPREG